MSPTTPRSSEPSCIALIPARAGSKRVADKNIRELAGHPMLAYSIAAAVQSGVFAKVVVSTDSERYAGIARRYGAEVPFLRPAEIAGDKSPDIEWVESALRQLGEAGHEFDCFSILRPTSPFRLPETIRRAWREFLAEVGVDSLRAVEKCAQHPGKMWVVRGTRMSPLLPLGPLELPWHSTQYAALPEVFVQNASLEIAWTRVVPETRTISGHVLMPFLTQGSEGLDVNTESDWWHATHLIERGEAVLPVISIS
jgi:N-acylneuraminate cytidylyltransferase